MVLNDYRKANVIITGAGATYRISIASINALDRDITKRHLIDFVKEHGELVESEHAVPADTMEYDCAAEPIAVINSLPSVTNAVVHEEKKSEPYRPYKSKPSYNCFGKQKMRYNRRNK